MPTINEMLAQYYNTPVGSTASSQGVSGQVELSVGQKTLLKQAEVDAVAQRKREILSGESVSEQEAYRLGISKATGYGTRSAAPLSKALLTNSVGSLVESNGPSTALRLLEQQMAGENSYGIDKNMPSTASDTIGDTALNITTSLVNTVGGAGAWAGSLINDRLGTYLSGGIDSFNNLIEPMASSRSQSSRTLARITNELDTRDNEAQYQEDKTKGNVLAKLKREGRNAIGAVSIAASDPTMLLEGTAKAIGSMAAFGYVNKAVQGIGGAGKVATMIRDASTPISGGLVGGGSVYQQTVSEIMAKSLEEMAKISPRFNEYVAQGLSPKDAQVRVAAEAGEYAASIAAPLGAATTMMAPGLEKLPVKVGSVKGAIKSTLFEPVQESVESFDEQLATNLGKQRVFDPKQDLAEGIGKPVGEGVLYGLTSAGTTQAPGVAALGAKALKDGTSSFVGSMKEKIGALREDNKNSSPVSDAALAATATTVATQVPAVVATMQAAVKDDPAMQEKVTNFTAIMQSVSTHDAADFDSASDSIKKALTGAVTKIDELTALKSVFNNKDSTDADRDFAGAKLVEELDAVSAFLDTQTDVIDALQDEPTKKFVRELKQLSADILGNKEFLATRNAVATRLAEKHKTSQPELAISADPASQEGKQAIAETLAVASTLPTEVNEKAVEAILKHSERGSLKLTPTQKANLEISKAAIAALQDDLVEGTELMRVSTEAANAYEAGSKGKSAIQHATDIVRAMSEGNISLAKTLLKSFERFAQHYQNKAEAVNQATQEGNDQDYKAEYRQLAYGQWLKEKALYTFQKSGRGVELATQVHKEARAIGSMYNAIAAMYPDLQLDQVTLTEPDPIFLPNGKFDHKVTQHGIGGNGVAGITAYRNRLSNQQAATPKDDKPAREAAGIATATLETNEDKLRFAAWADAHSGKSVQEVQLALVRSEFGPKLGSAEVKQVAEAISSAGGVVADQARINAQPAKQKSDSEKLASAIKIQKMRVEEARKSAANARDVDQFGLPIENGPKRKFALERLKKAEDDLAALEAKAAPNQQETPAGADAGNGFKHGPKKGERYRVGVSVGTGGVMLEKRLPAGTAATFYIGKDGNLIDGDSVNLIGDGKDRLWIPATPEQASQAMAILDEMGRLDLTDPKRKDAKARLKALVTATPAPEAGVLAKVIANVTNLLDKVSKTKPVPSSTVDSKVLSEVADVAVLLKLLGIDVKTGKLSQLPSEFTVISAMDELLSLQDNLNTKALTPELRNKIASLTSWVVLDNEVDTTKREQRATKKLEERIAKLGVSKDTYLVRQVIEELLEAYVEIATQANNNKYSKEAAVIKAGMKVLRFGSDTKITTEGDPNIGKTNLDVFNEISTASLIVQEAVVTKGSKAPLTSLFGDVLSNAILNIIDSVNKEAVKNKTLDFDVFLVKFVKDISSIPSTGFDALNKVREQQSNVLESGEFEWTKKEQKFGDVYYYPKKQTKEGIEIEKYVYKTSTYEITRSGPTDTIIFNSPIKFGEFEVKTIYASPGSFKLVSEDYAQQYINNELYVYGKELDIKIGGTNKRNSMVTYRRKSGIRSNGLYATFYENYYKIDPKYRSKNSFPLVFDEKGNNSYSEIVTTNPQTPIVQSETTEPTIAEIQKRLDTFTDDELRKEWNRIAAIAKPRPEIEKKTAKLIAAILRQRKADDEAAKAALPTQTLDEVFGNDRLEEAKKIAEEKAAYLAEMEKIGAFRSLYYDLRDSVTKRGMFTIAEHRELFKDDNRFNFLRSKKPYATLDALIPDGRFDAYGISRDYATGIRQIADKLKAGDFLTLADKIRLQEIEVKLAELENIPDEQLNELIALYEAKTKTEAEKTAKQRRDAKSKREARQAASKGGTSTTKINQGEQGILEFIKQAPKIGETSTEVKGRFTITKTVVSDNTVLSVHTNNEDGKVTKSEYVTTYPDIYSDELGNKYTVVIYRDSANPSVITDVKSFDAKDKKNTSGFYGKAGTQTDEQYITTFTEAGDVTLEYTDKFEKPLAKVISGKQAPVESTTEPKEENRTVTSLEGFTNHSGGAIGADTAWDSIGKEFGLTSEQNKHYYFEGYKTPIGNTPISINLKKEADEKLIAANKTLGRKFPTSKEYVNNLLRRNWWQVKNADAIFAIASITDNKVNGGTGWAVHMAIAENKPVYVFDQTVGKWFTWSGSKFEETTTPQLTKNFAGIGTREINDAGKQAIKDVYKKTLGITTANQTNKDTGSSIYDKLGDKTVSDNVVIRPWGVLKNVKEAVTKDGIVSTRIQGTTQHFGNPYSASVSGLIKVDSDKDAVISYIDWVLSPTTDVNPEQHAWIREQLISGKLKGQPILYYKELNAPSHATALDYLINKHDWGNQATSVASATATPEPTNKINVWYGSGKVAGENAGLSNLAAREFTFEGRKYFSVEHAYQTYKSGLFDEVTYNKYKHAGVKISGKPAKKEKDYNIRLMRRIMLASFTQNKEAKDLLLSTGDAEITHTQDKGIWATKFPQLLMEIRSELRTTPAVNPISAEELDELNTFLAAKKRLTEIITNPSSYAPEVIVAAKKELTELTKERAKQVDYLFDGFPDELVELDFLSNVDPSLIANTAGKLERLWELRNKLGKLFADLGVSKLLSTAGNILIAGTKPVSKERVSQFIDRPFDTFVQIVNEKKDLKDNEKELRAALAEHITLRANLLKLGVERIVLDKVNSDNNLIKLLQLNHLDSLGNSSKHRVDLFPENRLFSLLAPIGKGDTPEVRLDPYLMETAALAFMQWMLSAADRKAVVDEKTVANILGIDENVVTEAQIAEYSERITNIEAIDAISAGIMRHWSLKPKDNIQLGYSEGVARVLAKEMLDVAVSKELVEAGFGLNHNQIRVDRTKTVDSYGVDKLPKNIKLANAIFPDLIDNTAFVENEQVMYIGENVTVPVSKTILREPNQLLTPEQIRAQDNNQKTIHRIDESSYKLFMGIGAKGVFDILSLPKKTNLLNVGHAKSVVGKKQGISAVFTKMEEVYQRVSNQAVDGDVHGVPIHYKFEYTSTNRLQMIGSHTPQASKWMRNVVLPTHGTIDASYGSMGYKLLMLSVAQNLGVSIQNYSIETNIDQITAKLDGEFANVIDLLKSRITSNEDKVSPALIEALKSAFGSKFTPSALYALHEYARYLATSDADKKNFNTGLYIEADGVNNGPAAALIMLGGAVELTREFFINAARVGYFIGSSDRTLNQQRQEDPTGLYEAGAQVLPTFLKTFRDNAAGFVIPEGEFTPAIKLDEYFDHVSLMVSSLLPNFSMDEDGNYAIGRSVIKNPLTKTVYGSGSRGMGNGLLKDMLEALYEKLSIVKLYEDSGMSLDQSFVAVFGEQYQDLFDSMDQLARHNVEIERGQFVVKNVIIPDHLFQNENYLKFEVSGAAFTSMSNNINTFFSKQVKDAITDVMSPAVMDSAQLLARATSFRTEFMAYEFNKLYEAALAKRKNSDHLYRQADGLSNDELRAITNKLSKIFPYIKTTTQSFNPVGRSKVSNDNFIGVTSTQYKVTPSVFIPESAGVSGVPYMIIGLGDGRTIQIFSDGGPEDTLNIYDGIHMGLGKAEEYSKRANSAVWDAWQQGNPFGALFPSLSSFISNYDWTSFVAAYKSEPEKIKPILAALRVKSIAGLPEHIANLLNNVSTSAKNIDATHQVLGEYKATIDQLASIGSPYVKPGADIVIDDASIAEINSKISSLSQANTDYAVSGIISSVAAKFNVPVPTKPVKYDLKSFIKKGGAANKTATIQSLMATGLLNNVSVEYGPLSAFSGKLTRDDYGGYDPKTNTIYIVSDKSGGGVETLTHEMIHAATFRAIANHYADPSNSAIANEVARLEALMESFLNRAALSKDEAVRDIFVKISGINNRSVKLNEFMAYGLSNPAMRADLASVNALKLSENIIDKYVGKIKQLIERILEIFGVKAQRTQYDQLVFNTVYVMAGGNNTAVSNGQVLKMSISGLGTNDRLKKVTDFFATSLDKHIKNQIDPAFANLPPKAINTKNPGEFTRARRLGLQVANLISSKFNATPQEQVALNMIVQTLATGAQMDGNIMSGVEELYTHFTKNLTVEDFLLVEPSAATQADIYEANEMYNLVMGNYTTAKDVYGRGQTLPIFFALGLVNDRFRAVLAKKGLPDALKIASTDTDTFLTSSANVLLSKMDKALTGTSKSTNTQQALDSIFSVLVQNGTDSLTLVGAGLNKTGSVVDGLNDRVVSAIEYVSAKLDDGADTVLASTSNVVLRSAARVVKSVAWSMDEKVAGPFGEVIVSLSNQTNLFKPLQSLIADFVGRTNSNKLLYDMIKFVRSSVQQDRQHYREELPSVLAAQFTRKLSDKEWTHLFTGLAKTDLAQLVDLIGIKETVALLSDPTKIDTRITTLEANLRNQVPNSWPKLQKKAKQLANYMMTGEYGPMLMRNADILQLNFGGNRDEIDSLVTLYALQKLEQPVKDTLLSLVQTQKTGIDTLVSYLSGQRKDDIHPNVAVRLNTYKGYIPSLQNESVSLKVMPDTEHAAMLEKGYIRTGKYEGSIIETKASSSYYFLNAPAKAAFSQGLIQNVHNTSGGVDTRTLFSTGLVAGRITDTRLVNKLAPYLNNDVAGNENLLPIFDETGAIIALERGVRPDQLVQLKQNTHLAKMIGVWRGRQVEEYKARAINTALVSRFKQMYSDDIGKNPATAREYVNLFDSKDPIHKDALKLMPVYMRKALESEFGKDTFMVRKDMVDSAIGYRTPSVGDAWTGISGWSPESLEMAKRVTMTVFGNKAYEYLVNAEQMLKNAIQDIKLIIVVKSVIVPVGNMLSNVIQLMARGVPIKDIVRNIPKKISEVTFYTKQRLRKIELEVALRAAEGNNDITGIRKAKNELETIEDSFRRLSIWPLINAGEFSAISDVGIARDDIVLSEGRLHTYIENLVDKLPEGVRTAAKYGLVAKDTALFQGLQKAVEYGDFLAKAIEYDYLIGSKKLSKEDSLARISEEFVNYDLLMGRFREYAENIGLVWFTAFKVRSTKIAASIIRNNPFHALMSTLPHSYMPAGTGSLILDNGVAKVLSGDIWHSLGFGQALRAPALNPWVNLAH